MLIVYIAGAVSGLPIDELRLKFSEAEMEVRKMGFLTINPVEEILQFNEYDEEGLSGWQQEMDFLSPMVDKCDGIFMLTDWKESKGARIEYEQARNAGKTIMFQPEAITADRLIKATEEASGLTWEDIKERTRKRGVVDIRKAFTYLALKHGAGSTVQVARMLGQDHTTVIHSRDKVRDLIQVGDPVAIEWLNAIKRRLAV